MSSDKHPYDPSPERGDAFGELAKAGYAAVPNGDHAARLARLRARTSGVPEVPVETSVSDSGDGGAVIRRLSPKPVPRRLPKRQVWWSAAAAIALFVVASLVYQLGSRPDAGRIAQANEAPATASQAPAVSGDTLQKDYAYEQSREMASAEVADETFGDATISQSQNRTLNRSVSEATSPTVVSSAPSIPESTSAKPTGVSSPRNSTVDRQDRETPTRLPKNSVATLPTFPPRVDAAPALASPPASLSEAPAAKRSSAESIAQAPAARPGAPATRRAATPRAADRLDSEADGARLGNSFARSKDESPATSEYILQRSDRDLTLRPLTVHVTTFDGAPLTTASITIEGSDQQFTTDPEGFADLALFAEARVARVVAPDQDTLYFDITGREDLELALAPNTSAGRQPKIYAGRQRRELADLGPLAEPFPALVTYLARAPRPVAKPGARHELQFYVSKQGRPMSISRSPAFEGEREDFQRAKTLLQGGPAWPEQYRGRKWRVVVK